MDHPPPPTHIPTEAMAIKPIEQAWMGGHAEQGQTDKIQTHRCVYRVAPQLKSQSIWIWKFDQMKCEISVS